VGGFTEDEASFASKFRRLFEEYTATEFFIENFTNSRTHNKNPTSLHSTIDR